MTIGVAIASYGEINFVVIGVVLQLLSVLTESTRLTLVRLALWELKARQAWLTAGSWGLWQRTGSKGWTLSKD